MDRSRSYAAEPQCHSEEAAGFACFGEANAYVKLAFKVETEDSDAAEAGGISVEGPLRALARQWPQTKRRPIGNSRFQKRGAEPTNLAQKTISGMCYTEKNLRIF